MENTNPDSSSKLKLVVGLLAILLLSSLVYIFTITSEVKQVQTVLTKTLSEKESVMKDLEKLNSTYTSAIAENTSMSQELIAERDKVIKLIDDLKKSKGDAASLSKYKTQYLKLQSDMKVLLTENEGLKKQNTTLTTQRDSTVAVLGESKKFNEVLTTQNDELTKTVEKGAKLSVLNLKTIAYKVKGSGKQIETDKASRVDVIKISFTIAENQIAKSSNRAYYVQVIDSKNNVLGDKDTDTFDGKSLTYSFIANVEYMNKTVEVSEDLQGKDFEKGTYFVNVFDKSELVCKTSFTLK